MQSVLAQHRAPMAVSVKARPAPMAQRLPARSVLACPRLSPLRKQAVVVCSGSGLAHPGEESQKENFSNQFQPTFMSVPNTTLAKAGGGGFGSNASLGAVLEKSKFEFVMPTPPQQAPKLDDGGDGGDIGKHNHNGGGGGDGGGGDDDDYFNEDGDGEGDGEGEGNGGAFFRTVVPESYDKLSIQAVMQEWMRTVAELPQIIRRAVEMGLFSSAQLVRFFSMDVRPNVVRSISRSLPPTWARDFVGRLMADPAFIQKLVLESLFAAAASLHYEYHARGENFKKEFDLAMINTIGMAAATAATVWLVAPTRSYGSVHKFPWQQMLDGLPNCVFDASGPLRQYSNQARVGGLLAKGMELSAVGAITGTLTAALSSAVVAMRQRMDPNFEPSVPVPSVARSSGGLAAFFAVNANARYQLIGGMDRYLFGHATYMWTYVMATGAARIASQHVGEMSRWWWQGLPEPKTTITRRQRVRRIVKKLKQKPQAVEDAVPALALAAAAAVPLAVSESGADDLVSTLSAEQQPHITSHAEHSSAPVQHLEAVATSSSGLQEEQQQHLVAHESSLHAKEQSSSEETESNFEVMDQILADPSPAIDQAAPAVQRELVGAGRA